MESYLPVIWAAILGLTVAMYVILDGFDLGIGILFPFAETEHEHDQMMNSVAPFWDGNETWLVLGGAGMMVAFPLAYSVILPALYLPVIIMLLALVFRGVAFEFRWIGIASKRNWTFAFAAGSTLAGFCQGLVLGGLIQGINVENGAFAGGAFDWATPFAVLCGLGLVISNFPYLVPPSLSIWQTAAAPATQIFMLMGTQVTLRSFSATSSSSIGSSAESCERVKAIIE